MRPFTADPPENWVCTPAEIRSHDQHFILPARRRIGPVPARNCSPLDRHKTQSAKQRNSNHMTHPDGSEANWRRGELFLLRGCRLGGFLGERPTFLVIRQSRGLDCRAVGVQAQFLVLLFSRLLLPCLRFRFCGCPTVQFRTATGPSTAAKIQFRSGTELPWG